MFLILERIFLKTPKDLNAIKEGSVVESENPDLLVKASAKRVSVIPLRVKNFFREDALVRAVAENESAFLIPLSALVEREGAGRAKLFRELRLFLKLCLKLKARFSLSNDFAESKFSLKSAREAQAIGVMLGLSVLQARKSFSD